jgi:hypothetical protein
MSRNEIERLFELPLEQLRVRVQEVAHQSGRDLDERQTGWIGTASKRQLLMETMWMLANAK